MKLADKIILLRKQKGWSQEELAAQMDVSRQSVSKWESGISMPDIDKIILLSQIFGTTTDYLLKEDTTESNVETDEKTGNEDTVNNESMYGNDLGQVTETITKSENTERKKCEDNKEVFVSRMEAEEYTSEKKINNKKNDTFTGVYWMIVTAIYLAYSFVTMDWARSWIIWPVAGVLFAAITAIINSIRASK